MYQVRKAVGFEKYADIPNMICETLEEAVEMCGTLFESGKEKELAIKDTEWGVGFRVQGHRLALKKCPMCEKHARLFSMKWTYDFNGTPSRQVCPDCWRNVIDGRGYDVARAM